MRRLPRCSRCRAGGSDTTIVIINATGYSDNNRKAAIVALWCGPPLITVSLAMLITGYTGVGHLSLGEATDHQGVREGDTVVWPFSYKKHM